MTADAEPASGRLAYAVHGDGGHALLLLHGLGADHHQPMSLLSPRSTGRWRVIAPDLRAHGSTTLPESAPELTIGRLAADIGHHLEPVIGGRPLTVIGMSMGAAVALDLLASNVLDIRAAALIRPAWGWEADPPNLAVMPLIASLLETAGAELGRDLFQQSREFAHVASESAPAALALLAQFDDDRATQRRARLSAIPRSAPTRPRTDARLLVLANHLDPVHPVSTAERVAADLDSVLQLVPPRYDEPGEHLAAVTGLLSSFLEEVT